jgi:hypothetical protein
MSEGIEKVEKDNKLIGNKRKDADEGKSVEDKSIDDPVVEIIKGGFEDDNVLFKLELDKGLCVRYVKNRITEDCFVDIRKFYKGYPTKKGFRVSYFMFEYIYERLSKFKSTLNK